MVKYDFGYSIQKDTPAEWAYNTIKKGSKVLEFGPAIGTLTKNLKERKSCSVDIIEIDVESGAKAAKFANKALLGSPLGDLDSMQWVDELCNNEYDYIVALDVIEHIRNSEMVLVSARKILKENGTILLSVPNVAHNSVLINLINNEFEYNKLGLLDNTHIHFFTYKSLERLFEKSALYVESKDYIQIAVGNNEIKNSYEALPYEVADYLRQREYADVYQMLYSLKKNKAIKCDFKNSINLDETYYTIEFWNASKELKCYQYSGRNNEIAVNTKVSKQEYGDRVYVNLLRNSFIAIGFKAYLDDNIAADIIGNNGIRVSDNTMLFPNIDSQIVIAVPDQEAILHIEFRFVFLDYDVAQLFAELFYQKRELEKELENNYIIRKREEEKEKKTYRIEVYDDNDVCTSSIAVDDNGLIHYEITKKDLGAGQQVRICLWNKKCLINDLALRWNGCDKAVIAESNAITFDDGTMAFLSDDPQIIIENKMADTLVIDYKYSIIDEAVKDFVWRCWKGGRG